MAAPPLTSAIIIFLDGSRFIEAAIASVFAQDHADWELLLVDDGSTDGSTEIARDRASRHPDKVTYLEHPGHENRGMSASRNLGIAHARGEYVAFLDADDVWLPHKLAEQLAIMAAQPRAGMVYSRTEIWWSWTGLPDDRGRDHTLELGVPEDTLVEPPTLLRLLLENKVQNPTTCSVLIRRNVFAEIGGFQEEFRGLFEDQAFFVKVLQRFPVFVSGRIWARYRQHADSCCARAGASGPAPPSRFDLLRWVERHLRQTTETRPEVLAALERELWPYVHPRRAWFQARIRATIRRLRRIARKWSAPAAR